MCFSYRLGESIAANNSYRQQEAEHASKRNHMQASITCVNPMKCSAACAPNDDVATFNIQDLIQKLQSSLEVNGFKIHLLNKSSFVLAYVKSKTVCSDRIFQASEVWLVSIESFAQRHDRDSTSPNCYKVVGSIWDLNPQWPWIRPSSTELTKAYWQVD